MLVPIYTPFRPAALVAAVSVQMHDNAGHAPVRSFLLIPGVVDQAIRAYIVFFGGRS